MHITTPENQRLVALLQRVAVRDHASFRQLYDLTAAHLYGVAMRFVRKRELADEVLQDAFINVWQHAGSYAASLSTPMTWLISIVRNKSLDHLRKGRLEVDIADGPHHDTEEAAEHADPLELLLGAMEKRELGRCLSQLEPAQRQSLALAYYEGLSHSEIASHLQVPLGTAKAWIRRALARLRLCYEAPGP
ncbi:sigma-70 family RNA polymerase sigma factor [Burkholderia sp. LMU1-1-1.1]|uniref:sigma-70 family RNA polymerase sigma factor n=1 Tax=Burkholderia sp. LMU1-1-1.1 TaxID=3135266 RepID=UPI003432478F